jgi:hypothetical protein
LATSGSRFEPGGESPRAARRGRDPGEHRGPAPWCGKAARVVAPLVLLTGLWVAVSPRFLSLPRGGNSAAADVIAGLALAGVGGLSLAGRRGFPGRSFTSLVLGVWTVLVGAFLLNAREYPAGPLSWSNTWAGAVVAVLALAQLATCARRPPPTGRAGGPRPGRRAGRVASSLATFLDSGKSLLPGYGRLLAWRHAGASARSGSPRVRGILPCLP